MYGQAEDILKGKESDQERSSIIYGELMDLASLPAKTGAWACKSAVGGHRYHLLTVLVVFPSYTQCQRHILLSARKMQDGLCSFKFTILFNNF